MVLALTFPVAKGSFARGRENQPCGRAPVTDAIMSVACATRSASVPSSSVNGSSPSKPLTAISCPAADIRAIVSG